MVVVEGERCQRPSANGLAPAPAGWRALFGTRDAELLGNMDLSVRLRRAVGTGSGRLSLCRRSITTIDAPFSSSRCVD
jgi:hypothetical protein